MDIKDTAQRLEVSRGELATAQDQAGKAVAKQQVAEARENLTTAWLKRACVISIIVIAVAAIILILWATVFTKGQCVPVKAHPKTCSYPWTSARVGLVWATPITAAALIFLGLMFPGLNGGGLVGYIVGKDKRLSTSKMQIALWTVAITFTFFFSQFSLSEPATRSISMQASPTSDQNICCCSAVHSPQPFLLKSLRHPKSRMVRFSRLHPIIQLPRT